MSWAAISIFLLFLFDPEFLGRRAALLVLAYRKKLQESAP
jgi:hypothetical protein